MLINFDVLTIYQIGIRTFHSKTNHFKLIHSKKNFFIASTSMIEEIKEHCNSRLNLIKILSNKKWGLDLNTLGNLYKSLIGSILDYSFPCLSSLSETNIKRLEVVQNSAVRFILKLRYDTPSNILHHEAYNKLKLLTLCERYVRAGLSHSVPLTVRLVEEYNRGFESRYIEYPTPLNFSSCVFHTLEKFVIYSADFTILTMGLCTHLFIKKKFNHFHHHHRFRYPLKIEKWGSYRLIFEKNFLSVQNSNLGVDVLKTCASFSTVNTFFLTFSGLHKFHPSYQVPTNSCSDLSNATRFQFVSKKLIRFPHSFLLLFNLNDLHGDQMIFRH
ncbi:RNA-directed DNA polymerase from mobile element jockey-like [Brachionus plicatilis]|uniref:RNA-directed DNA polymerase from mobile element jockey-like n=1 Tax=Brachionus plicatilis TaxID=10195 RepID=A0A3M7S7C0_BRAPC|nr:RNA-directed DNA polymerase from mobile element jockey-like [Brachionus plicatilis]